MFTVCLQLDSSPYRKGVHIEMYGLNFRHGSAASVFALCTYWKWIGYVVLSDKEVTIDLDSAVFNVLE